MLLDAPLLRFGNGRRGRRLQFPFRDIIGTLLRVATLRLPIAPILPSFGTILVPFPKRPLYVKILSV